MRLFGLGGETPEEKAIRERREASQRSLEAGGLPLNAIDRLREQASRQNTPQHFFTSDLSVNELALIRQAGYAPLGQVMGSSVYHVGWQWMPNWSGTSSELVVLTQAYYHARHLAIGRLQQEAALLGATGIVGVRLERKAYEWGASLLEFAAIGTAIREYDVPAPDGSRARGETPSVPTLPFVSALSGEDFWMLRQAGSRRTRWSPASRATSPRPSARSATSSTPPRATPRSASTCTSAGRKRSSSPTDGTRAPAAQLADIAVQTAAVARRLGQEPRVAFLSYSNFGNPPGEFLQHTRDAIRLLDAMQVGFAYEGEMSPDVALNPRMASRYPFSRLSEPANVLIMPGLQSANISAKLLKELGGGRMIGPLLVGMSHAVQIAPMVSGASELVTMAVLAASGVVR